MGHLISNYFIYYGDIRGDLLKETAEQMPKCETKFKSSVSRNSDDLCHEI